MATLFKRSNGIYYHVTNHHGRKSWRSTGTRSRSEAKKLIASGFRREAQPTNYTLTQFLERFCLFGAPNYSAPLLRSLEYNGLYEPFDSFSRLLNASGTSPGR